MPSHNQLLYSHHVIPADETPVLVNKDGCQAGAKSKIKLSSKPRKRRIVFKVFAIMRLLYCSHIQRIIHDAAAEIAGPVFHHLHES